MIENNCESINAIVQEDLEYIANSNMDFSQLKNSTILITGATGLIGVSLVRTFLCINRLKKTNIKILALVRNLEKAKKIYGELTKRPKINFIVADLMDKISIDEKINFIFHCASITSSKLMVSKPVETILTAVEGTNKMLELAMEKKVQAFVYLSSMEMYGSFSDTGHNVSENELGYIDLLNVRSNYPESKRVCENMCIAYLHEYGVPIKIARLAQTFGPGVLPGENRVFMQFARSVLKGENIILHTLGTSEGNYCYIRDAIQGLLTILLKGKTGEAYNVSNPDNHMTIADMAQMVCDKIALGKIKLLFEIPETNVYGYAPDTKMKLKNDKLTTLGWAPEVGLEESYRRLIESIKLEGKNE